MDLLDLIYKKRAGQNLSAQEINTWIRSLSTKKSPPLYQISSLLAFIYQKGMTPEEITALTNAIRYSGVQFRYKGFPRSARFVDKHSTGGVGDKITIPLLPITLACHDDLFYPTIAGRGLGHTGGTVDKLQSIPGFRCDLGLPKFYRILKKYRGAFLGQTREIAPADRLLYSLRDVTGTVESIPLITASILSKKLSETLNFLLLDLKCGNGAFIRDEEKSKQLAESLSSVATLAGVSNEVLMTSMDTPLGHYSGNFLEIKESLDILKGAGPSRSTELTYLLAERFLKYMGIERDEARRRISNAVSSGRALEIFEKISVAQGASLQKLERKLKQKPLKQKTILAPRSGYLFFETRELGLALVELGGGRKTMADKIDDDVGFYHPISSGEQVKAGQEILTIFYRDSKRLKAAIQKLDWAIQVVEEKPRQLELLLK